MKFALCNEMFETRPMAEVCSVARKLGYHGLELAPFTLAPTVMDISSHQRRETRRIVADHGLEVVGLHWLFARPTAGKDLPPLHLTTRDQAIWQRTRDYLAALLDLCSDLGGKVLVLGSPKQRSILWENPKSESRNSKQAQKPEIPNSKQGGAGDGVSVPGASNFGFVSDFEFRNSSLYQGAWKRAVDLLASVVERAGELGLTICFEPLAPVETNFINTVEEGMKLVREVNHPSLRIHLDVKAMCSEGKSVPAIIRSVKTKDVGHFHVNDPNLYGPGMGDVDYAPIAQAVRDLGYNKWLSVEPFKYDPDPETVAKKSMECLKRFWP